MGTNMRFRAALLTRIGDGEDWPVSLRLHNIGHMNCIVGCIYFVYIFIIFLHYCAYFLAVMFSLNSYGRWRRLAGFFTFAQYWPHELYCWLYIFCVHFYHFSALLCIFLAVMFSCSDI